MRALILCTLVVAASATGYFTAPAVGARFSYGYTSAGPVYGGYGYAAPYAAAPIPATYNAAIAPSYAAPVAATYAAPAAAYAAPVAAAYAAPVATSAQHHSQDELGQYNYGYSDINSAKNEVKTADGVVRGSYSYVDSYGILQKVNYISDALGFRVSGTNLPVGPAPVGLVGPAPVGDTPEVVAAKSAHFAAHAEALARSGRKRRSLIHTAGVTPAGTIGYGSLSPAFGYAAPVAATYAAAPAVAYSAAPAVAYSAAPAVAYTAPLASAYAAPVTAAYAAPVASAYAAPVAAAYAAPVASSTQHHSQDELGQYNYGYSDINSAKNEVKTADGVVRGSYSYVDSYGIPQKVNYISDALGFRVSGTNLPVGHAPVGLVGPAPVGDTPEVAAAKYAHFAAHAEALSRASAH